MLGHYVAWTAVPLENASEFNGTEGVPFGRIVIITFLAVIGFITIVSWVNSYIKNRRK